MKKKFLITVFAAFAAATCALNFTACDMGVHTNTGGNNQGQGGNPPEPSHSHSYTEAVTEPTCTEQGYTLYTCECGESYTGNYKPAAGHSYNDGVCEVCGTLKPTEGFEYELYYDDTYGLTGIGTATGKDMVIPSTYNGKPVTTINDKVFENCAELESVIITGNVEYIGNNAFSGCTSLKSITLPDSLTSLGTDAFSGCTALESIKIPEGVHSVYGYTFKGCTSLTEVTLPESLTRIFTSAFSGCSSLKSITLPDGVQNIADNAFSGCTELTSITIPKGVTKIEKQAFYGCTKLESITVASGNTVYHSSGNCLIETASKTLILGCKSSVIPDDGSVTKIDSYAFRGCTALESLKIPQGVTAISAQSFFGCSGLSSIYIPQSVTSIGASAFYHCTSLKDIYYSGSTEEWQNILDKDAMNGLSGVVYTIHCNYAG